MTHSESRRNEVLVARSRQRGQSLVGMAIMLAVLVPLAIGIMLLGQYMHVRQATQSAAREAAWDATVSPKLAIGSIPGKSAELSLLRGRQFAGAGGLVRSDGSEPAHFSDSMLTTFSGRQLLEPDDLTLSIYSQKTPPSFLDKSVDAIGRGLSRFGLSNSLPPNKQGLVTAEVHANTRRILGRDGSALSFLGPLASSRLDISARTVILADAWDAAGGGETLNGKDAKGAYFNRTVRGVVNPMVPSNWFGGRVGSILRDASDALSWIPLIGPGLNHFEPGRIAPDVVPSDKLVPYKNVH